jgi:hypothetical protein
MVGKAKIFGVKLPFLFVTVFILAVLTVSIPFFSCASRASMGNARTFMAVFAPAAGSGETPMGGDAFWGAASDRLHIDFYAGASDTHDYQKAVSRHRSEADRRAAREAEGASLRVWHNMLKTYEREYIRSVYEGGSCATGRSVCVRNCLKAIERTLPS